MYSLPVFGDEPPLLAACPTAREPQYIEAWKHVLTHRDLHLHPVRVNMPCGQSPQCEGQWVAAQDWPQLGLPAPIRLLLEGQKG
jgi:A/G-specific adenine glycosylase